MILYCKRVRKLLTAGTAIKTLLEEPDILIIKYVQMEGRKKKKEKERKKIDKEKDNNNVFFFIQQQQQLK